MTCRVPRVPQDIGGVAGWTFPHAGVVQWVDDVEQPKVCSLGLDCCVFLTFLDMQVGGRQETRTKKRYSQVQARHTVLF